MIVADRKKIPEIRDMIKEHRRVLLVGCGTCVTVCLAGGEREVGILVDPARIQAMGLGVDEVLAGIGSTLVRLLRRRQTA